MSNEISGEAMSETFEQLLERWDHYMAKSYYISLSDQKIIRTQLSAMRDELERVRNERDSTQVMLDGADKVIANYNLEVAHLREALITSNYPLCRCGANTAFDEPHTDKCPVQPALSHQAGADQSARVQAFNDLKLRHERLAVAARALWDAIPDYDWNFIAKDDGETDRAISEATNKLHAALSQEQATPRIG